DADDSVLIPIPMDPKTGEMAFFGTAFMDANVGEDLGSVLTAKGKTKQRSTAPDPGLRFAARIIDYGLWGILLGLLVQFLGSMGILSANTVQLLTGPFLAPVIITLSFVFVETAVLVFLPATPGKLVLDIHVATCVSNPYAATEPGALLSASWRRAFWVWSRGIAAGVIPFYIFTLLRARKTLVKSKETSWDFDSDCLVTHGKAGLPITALAALLVGGIVWLYATQWATPFWQTMNASWRYATGGASSVQGTLKTLTGDMPTYAPKELPTAPEKENRTIQLEKTAQELVGKQDWKSLSEHCLAWTKEEERNADGWFCYGRALHELADHAGAVTALKRATLLDPSNDDIRRLLKKSSLIDMQNKQLRMRGAPEQAEPVIQRGTDGGR
ncbi:MAG TPA: RDD family protein, partial [Burkholderiales bacterium]|nr:RDD family protein [Burkholderiales bacterium]